MLRKTLLPLSLVLFASACADAPVRLALQLTPGQEDVYSYSYRQHFIVDSEKGSSDLDQTLSFTWAEVAQEVSPDVTKIGLTFESTTFDVLAAANGENLYTEKFDSNNLEDAPSLNVRGYAGLTGRGFTIQTDSIGDSFELLGCEQLGTTVIAEMYNASNMRESIASQSFARQISTQAMRGMLLPLFAIYPSDPVSVGDTWTRRIEILSGFPRSEESQFELVERKDGQCRITVTTTIAPLEDAPISYFGAKSARTKLTGTQTGEFTLDEATGRILSGRLENDLKGTMEIFATEQTPANTTPMTFNATLTIRKE